MNARQEHENDKGTLHDLYSEWNSDARSTRRTEVPCAECGKSVPVTINPNDPGDPDEILCADCDALGHCDYCGRPCWDDDHNHIVLSYYGEAVLFCSVDEMLEVVDCMRMYDPAWDEAMDEPPF